MAADEPCWACGSRTAYALGTSFTVPLSTAGWPASKQEAVEMARHAIELSLCGWCGHVQNNAFDPKVVPTKSGLRMFNGGYQWTQFLNLQHARLAALLKDGDTVLEVGHGNGEFLERFASGDVSCRLVGIDPSGASIPGALIEEKLFEPKAVLHHQPDLIVLRHVLEHLKRPRSFLEGLCSAVAPLKQKPLLYVEVPSISNALKGGRFSDFLYEHPSNFTPQSLRALWANLPVSVLEFGTAVEGEILWAIVELNKNSRCGEWERLANEFACSVSASVHAIHDTIRGWLDQGEQVVVWGGTGKAAMFLNRVGITDGLTIVDSDERKLGEWVSGLGFPIESPDRLRTEPNAIIVIPSCWRVGDVLDEISRREIRCKAIYTEMNGQLSPVQKG